MHSEFCRCPRCRHSRADVDRVQALRQRLRAAEEAIATSDTPASDAELQAVIAEIRVAGYVLSEYGGLYLPAAVCGSYAHLDSEQTNWIGLRTGERHGIPVYEALSAQDPMYRENVSDSWAAIIAAHGGEQPASPQASGKEPL